MGWDEVKKINSDMKVPLDVYQYLNDYRLWGEDSYVYQDKSKLHKLYETTVVSMNDRELMLEAFVYLIENNKHIGKAFCDVYGIGRKDTLSTLSTMQAVAASSTAMQDILNSPNCMLLQNTGLPDCKGGDCYGKFLLVGSKSPNSCVDLCSPNYKSYVNNGYNGVIQSPKFGTVYIKIGVPNVPANTIFTMLNDYGSGDYCIVYKLQ